MTDRCLSMKTNHTINQAPVFGMYLSWVHSTDHNSITTTPK